jgi:N-methylhydantoinase A
MFSLFAFGGMGPVHAAELAAELGVRRVVIPPLPGLFSSLSLLFAEVEHHLVRSSAGILADGLESHLPVARELIEEGRAILAAEGYPSHRQRLTLSADLHYVGQDHALTIQFDGDQLRKGGTELSEAFHAEHSRTYGYQSEEEVAVRAVRCVARGIADAPRVPESLEIYRPNGRREQSSRRCYFGDGLGWVETTVLDRQDVGDERVMGPAVVEEESSLTLVPPGWTVHADEFSNLVLTSS